MPRYRRAAAIGVAALALAGCSRTAATPSATQPDPNFLLTQATQNAKAATAVHIRGTGQCPQGPFTVDMNLRADGKASGQVTFGKSTVSVVATKDQLLLFAPQSFWAAQASKKVAARIGNKWLRIPRTTNPCISALTSQQDMLANYLVFTGTPVVQSGDKFNGTPATQVGIGSDVAFWIQKQGTLLPINVHDSTSSTDIVLDQWNANLQVVVPPDRDIIDAAVANKA